LLSGEIPGVVSTKLTQFGYDIFQTPVSTFAPVTNVPIGQDYVVGPGDSFTVTLWGRVNVQYSVMVNRSGEITLPEVGVLKIWGLTFAKLQDYLQNEFSRKYTDFKLAVTMDRLRTIRVYVVGEVRTPGSYTLSSLSTLINALFAAGGPSKNGTLRDIRLLRNAEMAETIDLYDFLLGGDKSKDIQLQDGDTIFIPLIGPVVGVAGNVKRPAIYETTKPMTLAEVLDLAGGVTFAGWLQRVQVERVENHKKRVAVDFDISEQTDVTKKHLVEDTIVKDGDVVKVFSVSGVAQNVVYLDGHVVRPGIYELKPRMKLRDIIDSYAALQQQPNLEYGEIVRLVEPDLHPTVISFNVGKLLEGDESENIELRQFDTIRVFRWDERIAKSVTVSGLVYRPGQYRLIPDMKISDLIDVAGGLKKNAYLKTAEITRWYITQDGMITEKIDIDLEKALTGVSEQNITLQDYDHLIVRPIPELEFDRIATIYGEVRFPGDYPVQRGETLSSLIERAGGFAERAYLKGAVFTRESAKDIQRQRMDELIRQIEESLLTRTDQAISGALDKETVEAQETTLKLYIPETPGIVSVVGEVFNPASLLYQKDNTVGYYLNKVGGMTKEADKKQLSVIKADGSVISMAQRNRGLISWDSENNRWLFGGFMSIKLDPGDTIVVPRKMDRFYWLKTTKDITQILFQIALTAGVVLAL
jgi:protein involved in polysaccharide export with SLBB domain